MDVMEDQLTRVVMTHPCGLSSCPAMIVLRLPIVVQGVAPKTVLHIVTKTLTVDM